MTLYQLLQHERTQIITQAALDAEALAMQAEYLAAVAATEINN